MRQLQPVEHRVRKVQHVSPLRRRVALVGVDAEHRHGCAQPGHPGDEPGLGAAAGGCVHDGGWREPAHGRLFDELGGAGHVAERTGRVRAACGDRVHMPALGAEARAQLLGERSTVGGRDLVHMGAAEVVQQQVAGVLVGLAVVVDAAPQHEFAAQPEARAGRSRLARVVRLQRAEGQHRVCTARTGLGQQELQLAGLVAAGRQPGAVVALEPDRRPAEGGRQPWRRLERRGQVCQGDAWQVVQVRHAGPVRWGSGEGSQVWMLRPNRCAGRFGFACPCVREPPCGRISSQAG